MKMNWLTNIFAVIGAVGLLVILVTWPVQLLWNYCLVNAIDGINPIGFWQALGIVALVAMLRIGRSKAE
jgi:hypothetical protein